MVDSLIKFLKDKITDKMLLEEIVDVFGQMCSTPLEEDMILDYNNIYYFCTRASVSDFFS